MGLSLIKDWLGQLPDKFFTKLKEPLFVECFFFFFLPDASFHFKLNLLQYQQNLASRSKWFK